MRTEPGSALLEVIVAVTILALAGTAVIALVRENAATADLAAHREEELLRASAFLDAVALWPAEDLVRRMGNRAQGPWRLEIQRPEADLYAIRLTDSLGVELLTTALYRPGSGSEGP